MCDSGRLYWESLLMMRVLLLLGACVCLGLSDKHINIEPLYGSTVRLKLHQKTHFLEFISKHKIKMKVLWMPGYPSDVQDMRWRGVELRGPWKYYELRYLTQEDSGNYQMKDIYHNWLSTANIEVIANTRSFDMSPGESFNFTFDLEPNFCNIYYSGNALKHSKLEIEIVRQGMLQDWGLDELNCVGIQLSKPCGIFIKSLQASCGGSFVIRDQKGNKALTVSLEMKLKMLLKSDKNLSVSGFGIFIGFLIMTCCCACMKAMCCDEDAKEDNAETGAAAEPDVPALPSGARSPRPSHPPPFQRMITKPPANVPPTYSELDVPAQPSGARSPRPSHSPVFQRMAKKQTDNVPPTYSYSEVWKAGTPSAPASLSDTEPRFEIKGMTFASDTANVYTSDKLNFL